MYFSPIWDNYHCEASVPSSLAVYSKNAYDGNNMSPTEKLLSLLLGATTFNSLRHGR